VPFDVSTLPGLVLWVDATRGVTTIDRDGDVSAWADLSPAKNDLTSSSGYDVYRPGASTDVPSGHAIVRFVANSWMSTSPGPDGAGTLALGTGELLIEVVWAWSSQAFDQPVLFATQEQFQIAFFSGPMMSVRPDGTGNIEIMGFGTDVPLVSKSFVGDTGLHLVGARRTVTNGMATAEIRIDGRSDQAATGFAPTDLGAETFGYMGNGVAIAEAVVVKGSIAPASLAALEAHLLSKYGLK
jgi:hypothetical protein